MKHLFSFVITFLLFSSHVLHASSLLIEAESFQDHGSWKLDTQFIDNMGSPYLLAHGLGNPCRNAKTEVQFKEAGKYHVWVRTKDWVANWKVKGQPGKFQLLVNESPLKETFGTKGEDWFWHYGGEVIIEKKRIAIELKDLTGFEGRCDAIYFSKNVQDVPPDSNKVLNQWRKKQLNLPEHPELKKGYDLVVVGGGYSGLGAAVSAARMGCKVALIQNRPVLGGNGSSEVRVWAQGLIRRGLYPHIGEIIQELTDQAEKSPGTYEEFEDKKKEKLIRAEENIDLFLNHHVYSVKTNNDKTQILNVTAFDTRTSKQKTFVAPLFVDCTGHGTVGYLAGADYDMQEQGHMGMSNMWRWEDDKTAYSFPELTWALNLEMKDFPYPRRGHGEWFWEGGFDKHPIKDLEKVRDLNFRAVYGAFNAMKNRDGAEKHKNARLLWIAYIGGPRESRRLMGDLILTRENIASKKHFSDGTAPSTWDIDLHYPKKQYAKKFPDHPFISRAVFDRSVDKNFGYPIPYRCFYSRNIKNLFMAGRCISVTHEALGTVRVMRTCGMMGEVVGKAASVCKYYQCSPREVYQKYFEELKILLELPGRARRKTVRDKIVIEGEPIPRMRGKSTPLSQLKGIVIDNISAEITGKWTSAAGQKYFVNSGYLYIPGHKKASVRFPVKVNKSGRYEVRISYTPHENRSSTTTVIVKSLQSKKTIIVNQQKKPNINKTFVSLGFFFFDQDQTGYVTIRSGNTKGNVVADAVQVIAVP